MHPTAPAVKFRHSLTGGGRCCSSRSHSASEPGVVNTSHGDFTGDVTMPDAWPSLDLRDLNATYDTLHMWTQIVGKTRLALAPAENHWWHACLYATPRGLTTSAIPNAEEPAFYAYAYPEPDGCPDAPIAPSAARYDLTLHEWVLPYEAVRTAPDPDAVLLEFLQSTYEAAANLAGWDRTALERTAS